MKKLLLITALMLVPACTDNDATVETLVNAGFKDIETDGYGWFACGQNDHYATKFTATNPTGKRVSGVVCCGLLKSCTVRF